MCIRDSTPTARGYPIYSDYIDRFYLPLTGPTTIAMIRAIQRASDDLHKPMFTLDVEALTASLGISDKLGSNSRFQRTLDRANAFKLISQIEGPTYLIPSRLPALHRNQTSRLHPEIQASHRNYLATNPPSS